MTHLTPPSIITTNSLFGNPNTPQNFCRYSVTVCTLDLSLKCCYAGGPLDDLSITDLYGDSASKSRKSSGFSETTKSRNCSGLDGDKSRNCSGNSISQGLASAGFLSHGGSNPMNIPGSGDSLLDRADGFGLLGAVTSDLGREESSGGGAGGYMTGLGGGNLGFSSGLFDFGPSAVGVGAAHHGNNVRDAEICRLREELGAARSKLQSWEESMGQARTACDAWKKEAALANKKAEIANKEKDVAIAKCTSLQKEVGSSSSVSGLVQLGGVCTQQHLTIISHISCQRTFAKFRSVKIITDGQFG